MTSLLQRSVTSVSTAVVSAFIGATTAWADFGGSLPDIAGTPTVTNLRTIITNTLSYVLGFLALIAVVVIIIAGIRLIVSQGNEEQRDAAKKTILYAIVGLLVVLFARVIVAFFTQQVVQGVNTGGG